MDRQPASEGEDGAAGRQASLTELAAAIVGRERLATKLTPIPSDAPDTDRRVSALPIAPARATALAIQPHGAVKVPAIGGMADRAQRGRILHAFANHELQAVELFAWALLAYPDAPAAFRRGLAQLVNEEQVHARLYIDRLDALNTPFGSLPVTGYFWRRVLALRTPAHFVCAMSLTFEQANLDHAPAYAAAARQAGDEATGALLDRIAADEVHHVRFGWEWLGRFKREDESMWDAWTRHLDWPLRPAKARGQRLSRDLREQVGMPAAFIDAMEATDPSPPRRPPDPRILAP